MKISWVTLERICAEEMLSDEKISHLIEGGNRPLRSGAGLSDEELLDKLRRFGLDLLAGKRQPDDSQEPTAQREHR